MAHELGHAILHDVEFAHSGLLFKSRRMEEEADYFAMRLLGIEEGPDIDNTEEAYCGAYGIRESSAEYLLSKRRQK